MNVLDTPPVPTLSDFRLSTRQEHLVREIARRRRDRRRGGLALGGGALVASGVTSVPEGSLSAQPQRALP